MELALFIAIPLLLALLMPGLAVYLKPARQGWLLAGTLLLLMIYALTRLPVIAEAGSQEAVLEWVPQLGLALHFYLDGLSLLFVLVVTGIGAAVMFYAGYYFEDAQESGRFLALLIGFSGSMLALVLAGNLLMLFIAWEMTSVLSFLLIGFKGKDPAARHGALQALMITGGGGLALVVGLVLAGTAAGTMTLSELLASGDLLREHPWYTAIALLVMLGSFSKSAQFPLHFWLPQAMTAPTPASTYLHAATMVKAGVYLLARFYPVLGDTPLWTTALTGIGLTTLFIGALLALRQRDLKGCLAFSTISQLGALVALIGLPEAEGIKAAMVGVLAHALYKGALFMVVGAVDHAAGTRDLDALATVAAKTGRLRQLMPGFAAVTALAGLSMAGVPPLLGFVAKELLIDSGLHSTTASTLITGVIVISAALTVTMALIVFWDVFMRGGQVAPASGPAAHDDAHEHDHAHYADHDDQPHFHTPPAPLVYGPLALALLSLLLGIGIGPLVTPLIQPAVGKPISLYLLPPGGINTAFILSMLALASGMGLFLVRGMWLRLPFPTLPVGPAVYRGVIRGVERLGDLVLTSQNGRIRYYLVVILTTVILLNAIAGLPTLLSFSRLSIEIRSAADILKIMLLALTIVMTLASVLFKRHLIAALALGVAGYSIGGLFLLEPAPDVALVQFLVETMATVLIIMILVRTSEPERAEAMKNLWGGSRAGLYRDLALAVLVGSGVTIYALAAVGVRPRPETIATWHLANALPETGVTDVVGAIVTDFRGMDTMIEITVFGMAAMGVLTLLAQPATGKRLALRQALRPLLRRPTTTESSVSAGGDASVATAESAVEPEIPVYTFTFSDPLNRFAARFVMPVALLLSFTHILYGGSAPGDGFTAGVIAGLAVALSYVVFGYEGVRSQIRWLHPAAMIGIGLNLSLLNAVLPLFFNREFLAHTLLPVSLPASIKLASTTLFEIAIFLTVFGGISAIMEAITHPHEVEKP